MADRALSKALLLVAPTMLVKAAAEAAFSLDNVVGGGAKPSASAALRAACSKRDDPQLTVKRYSGNALAT
jgi:hypothetical protein